MHFGIFHTIMTILLHYLTVYVLNEVISTNFGKDLPYKIESLLALGTTYAGIHLRV